jgi:O-antigen ligase
MARAEQLDGVGGLGAGGEGPRARGLTRAATLLAPAVFGVAVAIGGIQLGALSTKRVLVAFVVLSIPLIGLVTRRARLVFLFCWVVCLSYNRNYFIEALGKNGSYGLYWSPADVFLLLLFAHWAWDLVVKRRPLVPAGANMLPWFLPFGFACLLSIPGAARMDWGVYEMARILRMGLILVYVRYNVRRDEWIAIAAGFAAVVLVQASIGVPYVLTGRKFGLAYLFGGEDQLSSIKRVLDDSGAGGPRRADGTLGHPNTFALYLLLVGPLFYALTGTPVRRWLRVACAVVGLTALACIAATLSRTSWAIVLVQLGLVGVGLPALGLLRTKQAVGVTLVAAFLGVLSLLPFTGAIERRFENFGEQVGYRTEHDRIAIEIWQRSPIVGIGLNHYSEALSRYDLPEIHMFNELGEFVRQGMEIRITAWVHNLYLLILAETGAIGLAAFLFFVLGSIRAGVRAIAVPDGPWRGAGFGLLVGLIGALLHGLQEAAVWVDPITYSFVLVVGLLALLPAVAGALPESRAGASAGA